MAGWACARRTFTQVQSEWYGGKLDVSVETQMPVVFSEANSLDLVVGCPNSLCEGVLTPCGEAKAKDVESPKVYYNRCVRDTY